MPAVGADGETDAKTLGALDVAAAEGDSDALERLVDAVSDDVYRVALRML